MNEKESCITKLQGKVHMSACIKSAKVAADNRAIKRDDKLRLSPRNGMNARKDFIRLSHLLLDTKLLPKKRDTLIRQERTARLKDDILSSPTPKITNTTIYMKASIY